jgi:hypothetical protein
MKSGARSVGLDKRRKSASITATANPTKSFPPSYEKRTCTPRQTVTFDLPLKKFLFQQAAAIWTPREMTPADEF